MLANGRFSNGQPTIGLLISHLDRGYMGKLWPGVADIAQEHGVNLLCFVGGTLHSPVEFEVQRNILYDLASPQSIDGFVVTCSMFNFTEQHKKEQFFDCYRTLPKVSTAVQLIPGIPNVLVDNVIGYA